MGYQSREPSPLLDVCFIKAFENMGWHRGQQFLNSYEWSSLISSSMGDASSRSTVELPTGFQPDTKVAMSCVGDSGLAMFSPDGSVHSMQPVLAQTHGLEDTQWLSSPGGRLSTIADMLESELISRGAGPETYIVHALARCPEVLPVEKQ